MTLDEAKAFLGDAVQDDGGLFDLGWFLRWRPGESVATLDGAFTADDLEAIAAYMRGNLPIEQRADKEE